MVVCWQNETRNDHCSENQRWPERDPVQFAATMVDQSTAPGPQLANDLSVTISVS